MLLRFAEAARRLSVTERALRNWIQDGRFGPCVIRLGAAVRIDERELDLWVRAGAPDSATWAGLRPKLLADSPEPVQA